MNDMNVQTTLEPIPASVYDTLSSAKCSCKDHYTGEHEEARSPRSPVIILESNPYKRNTRLSPTSHVTRSRSNSVGATSRSPPEVLSNHTRLNPVSTDGSHLTGVGSMLQMKKQIELEQSRNAELEEFCQELVKQLEQWRQMDKQGKLVQNKIE